MCDADCFNIAVVDTGLDNSSDALRLAETSNWSHRLESVDRLGSTRSGIDRGAGDVYSIHTTPQ